MKHTYKSRLFTPWRGALLAALLGLGVGKAQAQLSYTTASTRSVTGTYSDLGTIGTVITTNNTDDDNSSAQDIGFTFKFNGQDFTQFVLNTNGFLKLGSTAPQAPYYYAGAQDPTSGPLNSATETNLILPFNLDLISGTSTAEYRMATTGTAPNRVCTIQWKNVSDKARDGVGSQYDNFSFQAKLYETTNNIEFVYGVPTAVAASADVFKLSVVGIKGSGTGATQSILMQKGSATLWSAAVAVAGNYPAPTATTVTAFSAKKSVLPDAGRTYRFQTVLAKDARVTTIYSSGKLPIPFGAPHIIQAVVSNIGYAALTNYTVTAQVTGANTFNSTKTITTLAPGASTVVSFDAFTPTNTGAETITVTAATDDDDTNNTGTFTQLVTNDTFAYSQPGVAPSSSVGFGTNGAILAVKYTTASARTVTSVISRIDDPNAVGKIIYAVVCNSVGTILGRTPNYVVVAGDIGTSKIFTFASPIANVNGSFYAGVAQTASATSYAPFSVQRSEVPTRLGAYYSIPLAGGTPADQGAANLGTIMIEAVTGNPVTCFPATAVSVTNQTPTTAVVNFSGPANGTGYTIIYGATGFDPTSATGATSVTVTSSPFTLTGLTPATVYALYIRANCGATDQSTLTGPIAFTTLCTPPIISAFPFAENFGTVATGLTLPCGITVANSNGDNTTWRTAAAVGGNVTLANAMVYSYNSTDATVGADDWFFTPALALRAGSRYQLSFKYKTDATAFPTSEKLEVKYGTAMTPEGQTNLLWRNENITNTALVTTTGGTAAGQVMPITPAADGSVYIGFHAFSAPDQFNLYVDDIAINAVVTGVSDALVRAVNVYPNPSAGEFTVEVRGANAKGGMQVEVTNLLGQRVHTATLRDNFENRVNLSALANGMYTLKVKSGNEYMIRSIIVQK